MANIVFKTRGNSNPQGKSRVYFCAHPKNYGIFFEEISEDILKYQNCAIWYDSEPSADYDKDELLSHLSQMNLFVIPVTYRFLKEDCRARTVEFQYAIDNHIPVLPLMQEDGLDALFNEICGDLQFLYKAAKDDTAISFDEKLEKFLNSVLIGDELAEKIRAAFDAYIFLSYRKKDRKYAQELMRLIHKNDFCRDIAIWYDEFLVPGENFNDLIAKALQKSRLFALAVTPNLVNEENYVMTVEYPEAKKAGKKILPAELVPTDKGELSDKFEGIPDCADAYGVELPEALMRAFEELAIKENDNSPEHNFFIGLAYLGGIDVEIDHERAVKLITSAAEAGLPEAMEKLVHMYRNGEGVERNYHTAIEWQRRLVGRYKEIYEESQTEDDAARYLSSLWDSGDYIYELRNIPEAEKVYSRFLETARMIYEIHKSNRFYRYISVSYNKVGNIREAQGNLTKALECYEKSLEIREVLAQETGKVETRRDLSVSYDNVGNIYEAQGNLTKALECYEKSLKIAEALAQKAGRVEARRDLSVSYDNVGNIYKAQGNLTKALEYYEKSLKIAKALAQETGTVETRRDLSVSYDNVGNIYKAQGKLDIALDYYKKSLEIRETLAQETGTVQSRRDSSVCYDNIGYIYKTQGMLDKALEYYRKSLEIAEILAKETDTIESPRDLSISYTKIGYIYETQGNLDSALEYYEKSLIIDEKLSQESGTIESQRDLSISYDNIGYVYEAQGVLDKALEYHKKALEIYIYLSQILGTSEAQTELSSSYDNIGDIYETQGVLDKALEYYKKALEIYIYLSQILGTPEAQTELSSSYDNIGDIYKTLGSPDKALAYYEKSLEIHENLVQELGTPESYDNLAIRYFMIASFCDSETKIIYLNKAKDIYLSLVDKYPSMAKFKNYLEVVMNEIEKARQQ